MIIGFGVNAYANRAPVLSITSPSDNSTVQVDNRMTSITGTVIPEKSILTINSQIVPTVKGKFTYTAALFTEKNVFNIQVKNGGKITQKTFTINRVYSEQEKAEVAEQALKVKQAQEAEAAKEKAKQEAYDRSPAGRICNKHPSWSKDDCETLAEGEVKIGMTREQARIGWGSPDHINRTTNTYGTSEQWVYGYSSYLYFDDGILTSISN